MKRFTFFFVIAAIIFCSYMAHKDVEWERKQNRLQQERCYNGTYKQGTIEYDLNCIPWWEYLTRYRSRNCLPCPCENEENNWEVYN